MSDDREMTISDFGQPPGCNKCGMTKMKIQREWKCVNCDDKAPKTGQTVVLSEPMGKDGPVKIEQVIRATDHAVPAQYVPAEAKAAAPQFTPEQVEAEIQRRTNTVLLHVPKSLFPDLVMWARRLKLPKDWKEAEKIKAITDFQVEINKKLEGLS